MLSLTRQTGCLQAGCTRAVAEVTKSDMSDLVGIYFESAAVDVDCSHMTASSSASWSGFSSSSNFLNVNGHAVSTVWFMVCHWPQSQEGDWARPHLCNLAWHELLVKAHYHLPLPSQHDVMWRSDRQLVRYVFHLSGACQPPVSRQQLLLLLLLLYAAWLIGDGERRCWHVTIPRHLKLILVSFSGQRWTDNSYTTLKLFIVAQVKKNSKVHYYTLQ